MLIFLKTPKFLDALNGEACQLMFNLCLPKVLENIGFPILQKHFKVSESTFASRYKFYEANKEPSFESAQEWTARLRSLVVICEFPRETLEIWF